MFANEAMTTSTVTCGADTSLDEVARLMWNADCGAIPVLDPEGKPVGIVTDRDIAMSAMLNRRPLWEIPAATVIAAQQLRCCGQSDTLDECIAAMKRFEVRRLPVTDDAGKLVGIVSMSDALALTKTDGGRKKQPDINTEHVLSMMRTVASRHTATQQPLQTR